jgi:hypothetical protein
MSRSKKEKETSHIPVISVLGGEGRRTECEASLCYIARLSKGKERGKKRGKERGKERKPKSFLSDNYLSLSSLNHLTARLSHSRRTHAGGCWWFKPVILTNQEAEIRRIKVGGQPRQIVCETPSPK